MSKNIMFQGTGSSVGKSFINAAVCRILSQDGLRVAPYKSQNMALNSYITEDFKEMGRAQVMQAECAGIKPRVEMNPVLLKPNSDDGSQVIVNGEIWDTLKAQEYYSNKDILKTIVKEAYDKLATDFDVIVIEGAGSPAEINLRENDIVNMGLAELVDSPVILVCDIDKGGVFASLYGTVMLLSEEERKMIKGFLINKFRGDVELLWPGIDMIRELIEIPCLGVIPYEHLDLDDEDSISMQRPKGSNSRFTIGVIRLKHFSNASDFTAFGMYDDIDIEYYDTFEKLRRAKPDLLVIPGSKNSIDDLISLRESGMDKEILRKSKTTPIIGICGGFQIMGKKIRDPHKIESKFGEVDGLGLLDVETTLLDSKTTKQIAGMTSDNERVTGYEIHMGDTTLGENSDYFCKLSDGRLDGAVSQDKRFFGTYLHGLFDNDDFRENLLDHLGYTNSSGFDYQLYKEEQYDKLADLVRNNIDMELLYKIIENE